MNSSPPPFDPSKPFTVEGGSPPPFDPSKPFTTTEGQVEKPAPSLGERIFDYGVKRPLHAAKVTLEESGFMPPMFESAQEYRKEHPIGKHGNLYRVGRAAGSALGGTLSTLGLALGPGEAVANLAARGAAPLVTEAEQATAKLENQVRSVISRAFEKGVRGGAPTAADAIAEFQRARAQGQPLALVDIQNAPLGALAGTTYREGGAARQVMKDFLDTRKSASQARVEELIDRHLSDDAFRGTAKQLAADRSARARPLWDTAMSPAPVWSERLQEFLDHPDVQKGIARGWRLERRHALAEGRPINAKDYAIVDFNEAGDPVVGKVPNMKLLQMAKEGIDDLMEGAGMRDELTGRLTKAGRSVDAVRRSFLDELDRLNPNYRAAREQWAGDTATIRALNDGRKFLSAKMSPEELAERVGGMTDSERQFYTVGVADALKTKLFRAADLGNKGVLINTEDARMRLRPLFDTEEQAQDFIDAVQRERAMGQTATRVYGGSPTGERVADDRNDQVYVHAAHGLMRMLEGRWLSAAARGMHLARILGGKPNPALSEAIARALTDPNIGLSDVGPLMPPRPIPPTEKTVQEPALLYGRVPMANPIMQQAAQAVPAAP